MGIIRGGCALLLSAETIILLINFPVVAATNYPGEETHRTKRDLNPTTPFPHPLQSKKVTNQRR